MTLIVKMLTLTVLACSMIFYAHVNALPAPQDIQTAALMAMGQMKDIVENGAATRDSKDFEFMGAKVSNNFEMGFGDAMNPGRRRRSLPLSDLFKKHEIAARFKRSAAISSSSSSSESHE